MADDDVRLKVVKLEIPKLCYKCRFATIALVEFPCGDRKKMICCTRLDCDNWVIVNDPNPTRIIPED